jgi:hypothetical protein
MNLSSITKIEYAKSLETLLAVALEQNSSASEAAAEVILSLNNGAHWKLNLCRLHSLDSENYLAAMKCIHGKMKYITEPQSLINNSNILLLKLKRKYNYLKINKN